MWVAVTLEKAVKGQAFMIKRVSSVRLREQALRLGVYEGACFTCLSAIKNGPIVLKNDFSELAIGRSLAAHIQIELIQEGRGECKSF